MNWRSNRCRLGGLQGRGRQRAPAAQRGRDLCSPNRHGSIPLQSSTRQGTLQHCHRASVNRQEEPQSCRRTGRALRQPADLQVRRHSLLDSLEAEESAASAAALLAGLGKARGSAGGRRRTAKRCSGVRREGRMHQAWPLCDRQPPPLPLAAAACCPMHARPSSPHASSIRHCPMLCRRRRLPNSRPSSHAHHD